MGHEVSPPTSDQLVKSPEGPAQIFYRLILFTIHALYQAIIFIDFWYRYLSAILLNKIHHYLNPNYDEEQLEKAAKELKKWPRHLTIAVQTGAESLSYKDLVKIIKWADKLNIPYLSFYDNNGKLVENKLKIEKLLAAEQLKSGSKLATAEEKPKCEDDEIKADDGLRERKIAKDENMNENNNEKEQTHGPMKIRYLDIHDGRPAIVNAIKKLCEEPDLGRAILPQDITKKLREDWPFPDPEMMIKFGPTPCLFAYPPWQIRLTEIFSVDTHHNVTIDQFLGCFHRYNKTEKRFGR